MSALFRAALAVAFASSIFVSGAVAQDMPVMALLNVAEQEPVKVEVKAPETTWQHLREYRHDEGNDGAKYTVMRVEWNDRAEDGIDVTLMEQAGSEYVITEVSYWLRENQDEEGEQMNPGPPADESNRTFGSKDAAGHFKFHVVYPGSAGRRLVRAPEWGETRKGDFHLLAVAKLKQKKLGVDVLSWVGLRDSGKAEMLPRLE
jgi:hypothetical protein